MTFEPSKYQIDIFNEIENGTENLVISAGAGSGKTTTCIRSLELIPRSKKVLFVAFNRQNVDDIAKKAPKYTDVMSLHSLGNRGIYAAYGKRRMNKSKDFEIAIDVTKEYRNLDFEEKKKMQPIIMKMCGLLKGSLLEPTEQNIDEMANHHSVGLGNNTDIYEMIKTAMSMSKSFAYGYNYDDMIWMPNIFNLEMPKYDIIMVDEAQDLNAAQLELVMKSVADNGRIIAVGDENQSMYGFRGADSEAIPKIKARLNAKVLPLPISYRCPKSHIALAQEIVPEIEAAPNAKEGGVFNITEDEIFEHISPDDLCICRYNAPLVRPAFALLREGVKVCIRGRDIGAGLIKLIKSFETNNIDSLMRLLGEWAQNEYTKADKKNLSTVNIEDKYNTIVEFAYDCRDVNELITRIDGIFKDNKSQVVFSSVHGAKGLEAENVFILYPETMPSSKVKHEWEMIQEYNILYVALTRAKNNLYMVGGEQ